MHIPEETKKEIESKATLEAVLDKYYKEIERKKGTITYECPFCGKGMIYTKSKGLVKCFHCGYGTKSGISLLMEERKMEYVAVMEMLASDFGVIIPEKEYHEKEKTQAKAKAKSFANRQLESSGLSVRDVRATLQLPEGGKKEHSPIYAGSVDAFGRPTDVGDDMVIEYYDLEGRPVMYTDNRKGKKGEEKMFFRVRWQYPESHLTKDGSVCKYKSPVGSGVHLYIPEKLRQAWKKGENLRDLYFTEGEKKAESVSKYVGPAFGMGGINALAGKDRQMPESVVRVLENCGVKRVFFIMDADWNDLSGSLTEEKDATMRPRAFCSAARNFRDWFGTLRNRNIDVEVYLVLGKGKQKGVDDQLMMLRDDPTQYRTHLERATNDAVAGGHDDFFDVIKISTITDANLLSIWGLSNVDEFLDMHRRQLDELGTFRAFRHLWRVGEDGNKELAQPLRNDEQFWSEKERETRSGEKVVEYRFDLVNCLNFLENRGYHRYIEANGEHTLVRLTDQKIEKVQAIDMRDEVLDLAKQICNKDIMNMMYRYHTNYLGPNNMSLVSILSPDFPVADRESQLMLFKTKYWTISANGIEEKDLSSIPYNYWQQDLKPFDARQLSERMVEVTKDEKGLHVTVSPDAGKCDFFRFLLYTSWFDWNKVLDDDRTPKFGMENYEMKLEGNMLLHLLSKMTAIGYLLHQYHNPACAKAVIAMDEYNSQVGDSQGRSGKSLISVALEQMTNVITIPAKGLDLTGDRFALERVTPQTRVITLDDIDLNFDFEQLFPSITSSVVVNPKGATSFSLEGHKKPKFYITTNHTITADSGSARDRQFKLAFSNYFSDDYKPEQQFGRQFFGEAWDAEQWNLFYNLMAECLQLYFEAQHNHWGIAGSGLIDAPCGNLEKRLLRQQMTEDFYQWALEFYGINEDKPEDPTGSRLGDRIYRAEIQESYLLRLSPRMRNLTKPNKIWQRLTLLCRYFGYTMNPQCPRDKYGNPGHDKTSGSEFITISEKPQES